jgi:hypothetical protein
MGYITGEQEFVDSVFRFFVRLIEEAAQYDNGYHLFKSLEGPQADQLIATFVKASFQNLPRVYALYKHMQEINICWLVWNVGYRRG